MQYAVLVKYNELGQTKIIRTSIQAKALVEAAQKVAPIKAWEGYITEDGHTCITIQASSILSIQVTEMKPV